VFDVGLHAWLHWQRLGQVIARDELKEAREFFENPEKWSDDFAPSCFSGCAWTMLDGPDVHEVRFDAAVKRGSDEEDRLLRNEHRMQAGMMGGCDAYNDSDDWW
jgi:hypothetical protein